VSVVEKKGTSRTSFPRTIEGVVRKIFSKRLKKCTPVRRSTRKTGSRVPGVDYPKFERELIWSATEGYGINPIPVALNAIKILLTTSSYLTIIIINRSFAIVSHHYVITSTPPVFVAGSDDLQVRRFFVKTNNDTRVPLYPFDCCCCFSA